MDPSHFRTLVEDVARDNFVRRDELRQLLVQGLQRMINATFADQVPTVEESQRITGFTKQFGITGDELGESGIRLGKAQILQQLDKGKLLKNIVVDGMPINLERGENVIWAFRSVTGIRDGVFGTDR